MSWYCERCDFADENAQKAAEHMDSEVEHDCYWLPEGGSHETSAH